MSEAGIHADPAKIEAVKSWPIPKSIKDVRCFLGFTGYYRKFIQGFAAIARPLNDLLVGQVTNPKARKKSNKKQVPFTWGEEQQLSFDKIIDKLTNPPVLAYANYSLPFTVHTDASMNGLGAVLYQKQDGKERVIAYASRSLKPSERNYPAHKLEFLALKWAVSEKFHDYLYGCSFDVITDNNPLTYILTTAKLDATGQRWVAALSDYDFTIKYRSGRKNADADGLSRRQKTNQEEQTISPGVLKALSLSITAEECPLIDSVLVSDDTGSLPPTSEEIPEQLLQSNGLTMKDWRKAQLDDPSLGFIISNLEAGSRAPSKRKVSQTFDRRYLKEWDRMLLISGVLHRKVVLNGQDFLQLVLPSAFREDAFQALHDDLGHQGRDRTASLIKQRFFWPGMDTYIKDKIKSCGRCIRRKAGADKSRLVNITSTSPMEIVCLDYLSLERSKGGFENILVITDHFSRYAQAIPTKNQTAKTTARVLFDHFIVHYGFPSRLHSDQGQNFESKLIKELCEIARVEKSRTTPYHPMGNGQVERFNQTLLKMLGTLEDSQKSDWKAHVSTLVHAYNATFHDSTGYSPYFLMFGRHPRLAIDAFLGLTTDTMTAVTQTEYIRKLKDRLRFAYHKAQEESKKAASQHKAHYDRQARSSALRPGDSVLVRNAGVRGKCKLADRWEKDPYVVIDQPNADIPVYRVQRQNPRSRKTRLLHRNFLLPFMGLPCLDNDEAIAEASPCHISSSGDDVQNSGGESNRPCSSSEYDGGVSDNGNSSDSQIRRYRIPMRHKPGELGLLPQTRDSSPTGSVSCASSDDGKSARPVRQRRKPVWLNSDSWIL
ncbi:MAG: RNase H-like domain-containing protein [Candidatus Thiodiazotropha endolucinida]|nr:DDE-type integrase/transposase/recombinase [Candidatus Thiodiazotropha taylori]MCW4343937.1 RNase H-like domain-containing protein [Candidatus Thiodiazotropha endolucinida]